MSNPQNDQIQHEMEWIKDPDTGTNIIYSVGVSPPGSSTKIDFMTLFPPEEDHGAAASTLFFLGDQLHRGIPVKPMQNVESMDEKWAVIAPEEDVRTALLANVAARCDADTDLLLVLPLSALPLALPSGVTGGRTATVGERELMFTNIRRRLAKRGVARFLNGDTRDCRVVNLAWCRFADALANPDWTTDWKLDLSAEEIAFVLENKDVFIELLG